jgi:hypothetical protein
VLAVDVGWLFFHGFDPCAALHLEPQLVLLSQYLNCGEFLQAYMAVTACPLPTTGRFEV